MRNPRQKRELDADESLQSRNLEIEKIKKQHEDTLSNIKAENDASMRKLKEKHAMDADESLQSRNLEIEKIKKQHEDTLSNIKAENDASQMTL